MLRILILASLSVLGAASLAFATLSLPTDTPELQALEKAFPEKGSLITQERLKTMVDAYCMAYMKPYRDAFSTAQREGKPADPQWLFLILREFQECSDLKRKDYSSIYKVGEEAAPVEPSAPSQQTNTSEAPAAAQLTRFESTGLPESISSAVENIGWKYQEDYLASIVLPHPSGTYVIFASCSLTAVDAEGKPIGSSMSIPTCVSHAAAFSKAGDTISWENNGDIYVADWRLDGPSNIRSCIGHTRVVVTVKFDASGQRLFSSSDDGTTRVWDLSDSRCTESKRYRFGGHDVAFSEDGIAYYVESEEPWHLVRLNLFEGTPEPIMSLEPIAFVLSLIFNDRTGRLFAAGGQVDIEKSWPISEIDLNGRRILPFPRAMIETGSAFDEEAVDKIALSSDARILAYVRGFSLNKVYLFDTVSRRLVGSFEAIARNATDIAFIPEGHDFFVANRESYGGEGIYWRMTYESDSSAAIPSSDASGGSASTGQDISSGGIVALDRQQALAVQQALTALGFNVGRADGVIGTKSREGVRAWQQQEGFTPTGELTEEQLTLLLQTP